MPTKIYTILQHDECDYEYPIAIKSFCYKSSAMKFLNYIDHKNKFLVRAADSLDWLYHTSTILTGEQIDKIQTLILQSYKYIDYASDCNVYFISVNTLE